MKPKFDRYDAPCVSYLFNALFNAKRNLSKAKKNLKNVKFDTVVVTGTSGIAFGVPLAHLMKKSIVIVRKDKDGAHSCKSVEATVLGEDVGRWLFVDDLIDTGSTQKRVMKKMEDYSADCGKFVGSYLYEHHEFKTPELE